MRGDEEVRIERNRVRDFEFARERRAATRDQFAVELAELARHINRQVVLNTHQELALAQVNLHLLHLLQLETNKLTRKRLRNRHTVMLNPLNLHRRLFVLKKLALLGRRGEYEDEVGVCERALHELDYERV